MLNFEILMINETGKTYNKIGLSEKARLYRQFALIQLSSIGDATASYSTLSTANPLGVNPLSSCISSSSGGAVASSFNVTPTHDPVIDIKPRSPYGAMYLKTNMNKL